MELSEEFILDLTQVHQLLFGFLFKRLADREQAREDLQRTNLVLCRKAENYEVMAYRKKSGARALVRQY